MPHTLDNAHGVFSDQAFEQSIEGITESLSRHRNAGFFRSFDDKRLYYEYFLADPSAPSVVVVHGLSEFTKKYYELTYYFLHRGYQVFLYDQRCHGFSQRLTDQRDVLHVDSFEDYVRDLETFIQTVVLPNSQGPLYIFSHSMGGAVTALYLHAHPGQVQKAVLSAPMFQPVIGSIPYSIARLALGAKSVISGLKNPFDPARQFNPEEAIQTTSDPGRRRFLHNLNLRINEPMYQTTPLSLGWVINSLKVVSLLQRKKVAEQIKTPLLLLSAEKDTTVNTAWHRIFADKCPVCRMEVLPGAGHSLMTGDDATVRRYVGEILDFFAG